MAYCAAASREGTTAPMIHLRLSGWWVLGAFSAEVAATQLVWLTYAPVTTVAAGRWGCR